MTTTTQIRKEAYVILCQSALALDQAKKDYFKKATRDNYNTWMAALDANSAAAENFDHAVLAEHDSEQQDLLLQAFRDWTGNRAYLDNSGNYHLKPRVEIAGVESYAGKGPIAHWNRLVKHTYATNEAFHKAAHAAGQQAHL